MYIDQLHIVAAIPYMVGNQFSDASIMVKGVHIEMVCIYFRNTIVHVSPIYS